MTIERKVGMGIAGQPSGGPTDVADVFSTYLYTGNSGVQNIVNGIDLAGEGGLVWTKWRGGSGQHELVYTIPSVSYNKRCLNSASNVGEGDSDINNFNSNGWTTRYYSGQGNQNNRDYASWTFRNSKKFFKAVTFSYGGSSSSPTVVTHDLGCTVGMTIVKHTTGNNNWYVQHKDVTGNDNNGALNLTIAFAGGNGQSTSFTSITDTQATFGAAASFPAGTYVAYFFADNSSEDAEEQMIKCGSYTGNGSTNGPEINLGWEPQFWLMKRSDSTSPWRILDSLRGWTVGGSDFNLSPNTTAAESNEGSRVSPTSTGFKLNASFGDWNASGATYIYMAIRGPMMVEPEAATDVFAVGTKNSVENVNPAYRSSFPVDLGIIGYKPGGNSGFSKVGSRLTQKTILNTSSSAGQLSNEAEFTFDFNNGWYAGSGVDVNQISWMWKRAKGFMDVVCYTGTGSATTIPHSLGAVPEMMWVKRRNGSNGWNVYTAEGAGTKYLHLEENYMYSTNSSRFNNTAATSTVFSVADNHATNRIDGLYVAYLFATLDGISKCGTYTGNGSSQTISCGFSAGARFILIKRTSGSEGDWYVWDSARGIIAGNDPHLSLNTTAAQVTSDDSIDPHNSGFIVNAVATDINVNSSNYIFYAIA